MKPRRYRSANPFILWQYPTQEQLAQGILAVMIEKCSLLLNDGTRRYYEQVVPYRHASLLRRLERGGDMPPFISVEISTELKGKNDGQ